MSDIYLAKKSFVDQTYQTVLYSTTVPIQKKLIAMAKCGALDWQANSGQIVGCVSRVIRYAQARAELNQGALAASTEAKRLLGLVIALQKLPCNSLQARLVATLATVATKPSGSLICSM